MDNPREKVDEASKARPLYGISFLFFPGRGSSVSTRCRKCYGTQEVTNPTLACPSAIKSSTSTWVLLMTSLMTLGTDLPLLESH